MKVRESHVRILVKSLTYTAAVVVADAVIVQLITHEAMATVEVLVATNIASLAIYFIHAHIWNRVKHGHKVSK
ncbi:MAG: hypothetical protein ABIS59_01235 [Candidatus Saccharibacteria bacterium]